MFIVILDFEITAADRDAALAALLQKAPEARAMAGNISYRAFANPETDTRVTAVQEWQNTAAFEAYTASKVFETLGQTLRPMMTAPPVSARYDANPVAPAA